MHLLLTLITLTAHLSSAQANTNTACPSPYQQYSTFCCSGDLLYPSSGSPTSITSAMHTLPVETSTMAARSASEPAATGIGRTHSVNFLPGTTLSGGAVCFGAVSMIGPMAGGAGSTGMMESATSTGTEMDGVSMTFTIETTTATSATETSESLTSSTSAAAESTGASSTSSSTSSAPSATAGAATGAAARGLDAGRSMFGWFIGIVVALL